MTGRQGSRNVAFSDANCLIGKSLQPKDPRKEGARHHPQVY
jgi:hypothetical protein